MAEPERHDGGQRVPTAAAKVEAEQALLGWQLRGEIGAIETVASEIGARVKFFEPFHNRVQAAIFTAQKQGTSASIAAIALQLANDPGMAETGGIEYLRNVAGAAPAIVDVPKSVTAAARSWRYAMNLYFFHKRTEDILESFRRGDPNALKQLRDAGRDAAEAANDSTILASPYRWRDPESHPTRQWLFGRHAARRYVSCTVASGGVGKSALAIAECLSLATGKNLLNDAPLTRARAWYIGLEEEADEIERRISAACLLHRLERQDVEGQLFRNSARDARFTIATNSAVGIEIVVPAVDAIMREIRRHELAALVIDPFVHSHAVPEADNGKIAAVAREWARIADETGCAVELVHHMRKGNGQEASADDARGASALVNAARSVRALVPMTKDESARAGVDNRKRFFRVLAVKANMAIYLEDGAWRELVSIDLGNGDGGASDHVQAINCWRMPDVSDFASAEQVEAIKTRISAGEWRDSAQASAWVGHAIADELGLDLGDPEAKESVKRAIRAWTAEGTLRVVKRPDGKRMLRSFVEVAR